MHGINAVLRKAIRLCIGVGRKCIALSGEHCETAVLPTDADFIITTADGIHNILFQSIDGYMTDLPFLHPVEASRERRKPDAACRVGVDCANAG